MSFYQKTVSRVVEQNLMRKEDRVLAVCAGSSDRNVFHANQFSNVVISNLDYHGGVSDYEPYAWELQDAESIKCDDDSYDWVVVHAGLHHCASPHHAMCEMLRVARKGILVFEARDSLLMKIAVRMGLVPEYELEPVVLTKGKSGGYRDSCVPNYVYRWTEREIEKTICSYSPEYTHEFHYFYDYVVPIQRLSMSRSRLKKIAATGFKLILPIIKLVAPKQGNSFAFLVTKRSGLKPWLCEGENGIRPDMEYLNKTFQSENYAKA